MKNLTKFASSSLLFALLADHASAKVIETEVVVVGGGISGLAAANTLKDGGFKDITVLEAKETIGGRVRSVQRNSGPGIIELGATWINNKTQPEVYALTELYGLETAVQHYEGDIINEDLEGIVHRIDKEVDSNVSFAPDNHHQACLLTTTTDRRSTSLSARAASVPDARRDISAN